MENSYDRRERTIYVSGMNRVVTEDHLYNHFLKSGPIEKVILKENQDGSPQHALVIFKNVDSVMYSIAYLQASEIVGHPVSIRPLRESSHHSALETAVARISGSPSPQPVRIPVEMQPPPPPYYLRSIARAQQQQQQQQRQQFDSGSVYYGGAQGISRLPPYMGPMGSSLYCPHSTYPPPLGRRVPPFSTASPSASASQYYGPPGSGGYYK